MTTKQESAKDYLNVTEQFITYDLGLAAALASLGYTLWDIDRTDLKKAQFIFKRDEHIDKMIDSYWDSSLTLPARGLFDNQKMLKNRLYSV